MQVLSFWHLQLGYTDTDKIIGTKLSAVGILTDRAGECPALRESKNEKRKTPTYQY